MHDQTWSQFLDVVMHLLLSLYMEILPTIGLVGYASITYLIVLVVILLCSCYRYCNL